MNEAQKQRKQAKAERMKEAYRDAASVSLLFGWNEGLSMLSPEQQESILEARRLRLKQQKEDRK